MPETWIPNLNEIIDLAPPFGVFVETDISPGTIDHSPAYILAWYLIFDLASMTLPSASSDWPLFVNSLPDKKTIGDDAGAIYDTAGTLDGRVINTGEVIEHYGIQVKIRARDYQTGWQKIRNIAASFSTVQNMVVNIGDDDYRVWNISRTSPIVNLGVDERKRFQFTVNFLTTMNEV